MSSDGEHDFRVSIVGGRGRMGRWLAEMLEQEGRPVLVADQADGDWDPVEICRSRLVVLAVPVGAVAEVMQRLGPHTRADGAVLDICSLKAEPLQAMLAHARGEVVGLHPLCGPSAAGLREQTVFLCRGRGETWAATVSGWCRKQGGRVVEMEPEAHDRLMSQVQSLRHLWLAAFGLALEDLGFDLGRDLEASGSWFRTIMGLLAHQCSQPPELYADLALANPQSLRVVDALERALGHMGGPLANGDRRGLSEALGRVSRYVAPLGGKMVEVLAPGS